MVEKDRKRQRQKFSAEYYETIRFKDLGDEIISIYARISSRQANAKRVLHLAIKSG